jgi:small conductance mechanosensitive channel
MNPEEETQQILRDLEEISFPTIVIIMVVALIGAWLVERVVPWIAAQLPPRFRFYVLPIAPIFRLLIFGFAIFQAIRLIIQPTAQNLLTIAGASAVAIGFAFKDYASSIVAGVVALVEQPYRPGDWVRIGGSYGEVQKVGLRAIKIETPDDNKVTIPHNTLWNENIINANDGRREHLCAAEFYLQPHHDAVLVDHALKDVAMTSPYVKLDRPITVIVAEQPWATHYSLRAYPIEGRNQLAFTSDLVIRGKDALAALRVEPARVAAAFASDLNITGSTAAHSSFSNSSQTETQ